MRQITINRCPALESTHTLYYCGKFWQWIHSHEIHSKITKISSTQYTLSTCIHLFWNSIHHNPNIGAGKIPLHTCWERSLPYVQHSDQSLSSCPALSQSEARSVKSASCCSPASHWTCKEDRASRRGSGLDRKTGVGWCGRFSVSSWSLPFIFFYKYTSHPIRTLAFIKHRIKTVC